MNKSSIAHRVFVFALSLVALYRIHLIGIVIGPEQVMRGLAQMDGITIAITVTLLLNLVAILLALSGRKLGFFLGSLVLLINIIFSGPFLFEDLTAPNQLADWIWSLIVLSANVLGLLFGFVAILERFGPTLPIGRQEVQGRILRGSLAALSGMLVLGVVLSFSLGPQTGLSQTPDGELDFQFSILYYMYSQLDNFPFSRSHQTNSLVIGSCFTIASITTPHYPLIIRSPSTCGSALLAVNGVPETSFPPSTSLPSNITSAV